MQITVEVKVPSSSGRSFTKYLSNETNVVASLVPKMML